MSAYPDKLKDGRDYVLQRKSDGKYLEVWGWSLEWADTPSAACPRFNLGNMGPKRRADWHRDLYHKFRSINASLNRLTCELVPADAKPDTGRKPKVRGVKADVVLVDDVDPGPAVPRTYASELHAAVGDACFLLDGMLGALCLAADRGCVPKPVFFRFKKKATRAKHALMARARACR